MPLSSAGKTQVIYRSICPSDLLSSFSPSTSSTFIEVGDGVSLLKGESSVENIEENFDVEVVVAVVGVVVMVPLRAAASLARTLS